MQQAKHGITILHCTTPQQIEQCYGIRYEVFSDEQGYSRDLEVDELDAQAQHFLALDDSMPIGTVRLVCPPASEKFKLGRLAVRKVGRGKGIAAKLILGLEDVAREMGANEIYAGAQVPVRGLYEKCGYRVVDDGETYLDEGQPHIMMVKQFQL